MSCDRIVLRYGEVFLKKGNRRSFLDRLRRNLTERARSLGDYTVGAIHGRYLVRRRDREPLSEVEADRLSATMAGVFGITSASPVHACQPTMEQIVETGVALAERHLEIEPARHFKVETSRSFKRHPFTSMDVSRTLGAAVVQRFALPAKMKGPDLTLSVEIHQDQAFLYTRRIPGPGGLPVGSSGRGVLLLSGGIDSPVAGWMMAKRGLRLDAVYFHSFPYTSERSRQKVEELADRLADWHGPLDLHVVPFTAIQEHMRDRVPPALLVLLYRRVMIRIAERVAADCGAKALVTGESLGQVASQTLENLGIVQGVATMPVLRPLVGFDKHETIKMARELGTYETSIQPFQDCCALFAPDRPETRAKDDPIMKAESKLELEPLVEEAIEKTETVRRSGNYAS